ncbi:MAG: outer membrane lipoprotein-sorting protein [Planctomycetes bacterium]|nr:outer membrane lipoprotein-sorting protein [Planctomycetota bacterium]
MARKWQRIVQIVTLVMGALVSTTAQAGENLEAVVKRLEEVGAKLKSMSAAQIVEVNSETADFKMVSHTSGKYEFVRKGDTTLFRLESETTSVTTVAGNQVKMDQKMTMICDGKFNYTISDSMGQKTAMKSAVQKNDMSVAGKGFFDTLKKDNNLKLLSDEKVDGKEAFVLEVVPKSKGAGLSVSRSHYYLQKDTGIVVKSVMFDEAGKPMTTVLMNNVKINPDIPGDRFKAPEGVKFMDTEAMKNRHKQGDEKPKKGDEKKKD